MLKVEGETLDALIEFLEGMSAHYQQQGFVPMISSLVDDLKHTKINNMSHFSNEEYLERAREDFGSATTKAERQAVIDRLNQEGFNAAALLLEGYVENGIAGVLEHDVDRSDELREREMESEAHERDRQMRSGYGNE